MLAVRETISYSSTRNKIIRICAAFIGAILLFLFIIFSIVGYGNQRKYEERTTDNRPIARSAILYHYTHVVQPEPSLTIHDGATITNSI